MPTVRRNDVSLYYEVTGSGPPIVLNHSFLCSGAMWAPQIEPLSKRHQVINVDLRGHGRSGPIDQPFRMENLVDDVVVVLDEVGIERAVWAGLSIGGMTAMRAALLAPERVSGLILMDTDAGSEPFFNRIKYRAMMLAARMFGVDMIAARVTRMFFCPHTHRTRPELVREWKELISEVPIRSVEHTLHALMARDSMLGRLSRIEVPALVIVGDQDSVLSPVSSERVLTNLKHGSLMAIENAGHIPTLEQPQAVSATMLSFLEAMSQP